jgi:serine protease Do
MRRSINWIAALAWLATGMVVAFLLMTRLAPQMHQHAVAAPAAGEQPSAAPPPATQCDARALSQMYVNVAAKLKPSVVTIQIEKKAEAMPQMGPLDDFFRQFHGGKGMRGARPQIERGLGSGFVIDRSGHVLTNNHVVDGADRVVVEGQDGRKWTGKVVGTDPKDDLAVIQVDKLDLPPVAMGDSDKLQVGELVMAIGSPFGLDQTVTVGVVSAKGRRFPDGQPYSFEDFIQTDAAINHGNSGGPLVNMNGEVVGVNSRIAGEGTGIGFSVSGNVAKRVAQALIKEGRVRRPYIGVQLQPLTPDMAGQFKADKGVVVNNVLDGSPAAKAGIKVYDVIVAVDGKPVTRSDEVVHGVQAHNVGQQVKITVLRDGAKHDLAMATAEAPEEKPGKEAMLSGRGGGEVPGGKYGIKLADLTPDIARELGTNARKGAVVEAVEPGSAADHSGLSDGDVIVEIDRRPIGGAGEVVSVLKNGGTHLLRVEGQSGAHFVTLTPEK